MKKEIKSYTWKESLMRMIEYTYTAILFLAALVAAHFVVMSIPID